MSFLSVFEQRRLLRNCAERRLTWTFAARICDKYQPLMNWLICRHIQNDFNFKFAALLGETDVVLETALFGMTFKLLTVLARWLLAFLLFL